MILYAGAIISDIEQFLSLNGENPWASVQSVNQLIPGLINIAIIIAAVVFFFMLLIGGIKWITAGGDKETVGSAQKTLTSAIIGIAVVFSAWAIKSVVYQFFRLEGGGGGGGTGQTCLYCENCENSTSKTHQCSGTMQGGTCKFDSEVTPNCSSCILCGDNACGICEGEDWCPQDCP
jgi:hypothetical protein